MILAPKKNFLYSRDYSFGMELMMKSCFLIICMLMSLLGCTHKHHTSQEIIVPTRQIGPFTHVYVNGLLDVTLHTNAKKPQVLLYGDPRDTAVVNWTVSDGVLRVDLGVGYPKYGPVRVDISSHYLTSFDYHGSGTIIGTNLNSNLLDLNVVNLGKMRLKGHLVLRKLNLNGTGFTQIDGVYSRQLQVKLNGKVRAQLTGVVNMASLHAKGESWLSLYWLKSHILTLRAKEAAFIQLAGISDVLDAELWDKARFNGRYLRGSRTFVKTHDHAEASIASVKRQHALANDASNIYYYNLPMMKTNFMGLNGSVLDMRGWEHPYIQKSTPYNHD